MRSVSRTKAEGAGRGSSCLGEGQWLCLAAVSVGGETGQWRWKNLLQTSGVIQQGAPQEQSYLPLKLIEGQQGSCPVWRLTLRSSGTPKAQEGAVPSGWREIS